MLVARVGLSVALVVHVTKAAPGLTAWAKRNASARHSQQDVIRNSAIGFASTTAATLAVTRSQRLSTWLTTAKCSSLGSGQPMRRDHALLTLRVLSGAVFVAFGVGEFINHGSELASFKTYGLPAPEAFVVAVGVIELVGGLLLIAGVLTRPAALVLAGDMIGAIVVSGIARGEPISLTLAPAELVAMLVLLWTGSGVHSAHALLWSHTQRRSSIEAPCVR